MQLIAMITMLIDHLGAVFFPEHYWMRIVGRVAFPLYCYLLVAGYKRTRSKPRYASRLFVLALLSQLPFMLAFITAGVNVIGTLLVALLIVMAIDRFQGKTVLQWAVGFLLLALTYWPMKELDFDYATYGVLLVLIYRYMPNVWAMVGGHLALNVVWAVAFSGITQFYSIVTTLFIAGIQASAPTAKTEVRLPRWLWRSFYPVHLAIIALVEWQIYDITWTNFTFWITQ
ncbi:TraX family protein [Saccharibacillus alkalitolerans]|uniref:Conjugal transfer protein TraX n=1 Tax=Saccharibacillus alkalitolerans TaxID=2705290 RepID=A0ABX0F9Z3_9BACL|nr:TraX family protein [Saccharibacillus alkalitolerans]NGZ76794.1 conjugal transfer protein TraX [Saccharibacillus alkalitolerans]